MRCEVQQVIFFEPIFQGGGQFSKKEMLENVNPIVFGVICGAEFFSATPKAERGRAMARRKGGAGGGLRQTACLVSLFWTIPKTTIFGVFKTQLVLMPTGGYPVNACNVAFPDNTCQFCQV